MSESSHSHHHHRHHHKKHEKPVEEEEGEEADRSTRASASPMPSAVSGEEEIRAASRFSEATSDSDNDNEGSGVPAKLAPKSNSRMTDSGSSAGSASGSSSSSSASQSPSSSSSSSSGQFFSSESDDDSSSSSDSSSGSSSSSSSSSDGGAEGSAERLVSVRRVKVKGEKSGKSADKKKKRSQSVRLPQAKAPVRRGNRLSALEVKPSMSPSIVVTATAPGGSSSSGGGGGGSGSSVAAAGGLRRPAAAAGGKEEFFTVFNPGSESFPLDSATLEGYDVDAGDKEIPKDIEVSKRVITFMPMGSEKAADPTMFCPALFTPSNDFISITNVGSFKVSYSFNKYQVKHSHYTLNVSPKGGVINAGRSATITITVTPLCTGFFKIKIPVKISARSGKSTLYIWAVFKSSMSSIIDADDVTTYIQHPTAAPAPAAAAAAASEEGTESSEAQATEPSSTTTTTTSIVTGMTPLAATKIGAVVVSSAVGAPLGSTSLIPDLQQKKHAGSSTGVPYLGRYRSHLKGKYYLVTLRNWPHGSKVKISNEMLALEKVSHPCLVPVMGMTLGGERTVSEWPPCGLLSALPVEESPSDFSRYIFMDLLKGLEYLHRAGIVHGNLCPDAVFMYTTNSQLTKLRVPYGKIPVVAKIADFTVSALPPKISSPAEYQAPELLKRGGKPTPLTDIYSLGVLAHYIFNMHTSLYPDKTKFGTDKAVAKYVLASKSIPFNSKSTFSGVPKIKEFIISCCDFDPEKRASLASMIKDLYEIIINSQEPSIDLPLNSASGAAGGVSSEDRISRKSSSTKKSKDGDSKKKK